MNVCCVCVYHTQIDMYTYIHVYAMYMGVCTSYLCSLIGPGSSSIPSVMSILGTRILASKYHFLLKGARASKKNDWFQDRVNKVLDKPGKSCATK